MVVHQVRLQENFEPNLVIGSRNDLEAVLREGGVVSGEALDLVGSVEGRFVEEWTSALRKLVAGSQYAERRGFSLGYEKAIRRMKSAAKTLGDAERTTLDRVVYALHGSEAFAYPEPPTPEEAATSKLLKETGTDNVVDAVEVAIAWRDGQTASADGALAKDGEAGEISHKFRDTPSCKGLSHFLSKVPQKKGLESPSEPPNPEAQKARIQALEANLERFVHACAQLTMHPEGNASLALDSDDPTTIAIGWLEAGGQWRQRWETLTKGVSEALSFEGQEQFDPDRITKEMVAYTKQIAQDELYKLAHEGAIAAWQDRCQAWEHRWTSLATAVRGALGVEWSKDTQLGQHNADLIRDITHLGEAELGSLRATAIDVRRTLLDVRWQELMDQFGEMDTTTIPDVEWMHGRLTGAIDALDEVLPPDEDDPLSFEPASPAQTWRRRLHENLTELGNERAEEIADGVPDDIVLDVMSLSEVALSAVPSESEVAHA